MGTLKDHIDMHVPHTVTDKSPKPNSGMAGSNSRADQQRMAGMFRATDGNGKMGTPTASPGRINQRINGVKQ